MSERALESAKILEFVPVLVADPLHVGGIHGWKDTVLFNIVWDSATGELAIRSELTGIVDDIENL